LIFARNLTQQEVHGRVIIVPAMKYPAFRVGTRTSPIDRGNLNRSFPGRPDGTVTERIADYFQHVLLPLANIVLDHGIASHRWPGPNGNTTVVLFSVGSTGCLHHCDSCNLSGLCERDCDREVVPLIQSLFQTHEHDAIAAEREG